MWTKLSQDVSLSVTRQYSVKIAKHIAKLFSPLGSPYFIMRSYTEYKEGK